MNLSNNSLVSLDLSNLTNLVTLEVSNQKNKNNEKVFTSIKLPTNTNNKLQVLDVSNNNLTSIDLSKNTNLKQVSLGNNLYNLGVTRAVTGNNFNISKSVESNNVKLNSNMKKTFKAAYLNDVLQNVDENNNISILKDGTYNYKIEFVVSLNGKEEVLNGIYVINSNELNLTSDADYIINNEKGYIYTGLDTDLDIIKKHLSIENGTIEINDGKIIVVSGKVTKEYNLIYLVKSPDNENNYNKYLGEDYIYTKISEFKSDYVKTNIDNNEGIAREIINNENNYIFNIKYKGDIIKTYKIITLKSNKYKIFGNYIYIEGEYTPDNIKSYNTYIEENNGKLEIKYNGEIVDSLTELKIDFGNLSIYDENISLTETMTYENLINEITLSDNLEIKLYENNKEITDINTKLNSEMILKVISSEYGEIKTYKITDEYINIDELDIEDNYILNDYETDKTFKTIGDKIKTSGSVKFIDRSGKELQNTDMIKTGSKTVISMGTKTKEYTIVVYGDINGDGKITMSDLVKSANYLIDETIISEDCYKEAIDVTKDGNVRMSDIIKLSNILIGSN